MVSPGRINKGKRNKNDPEINEIPGVNKDPTQGARDPNIRPEGPDNEDQY